MSTHYTTTGGGAQVSQNENLTPKEYLSQAREIQRAIYRIQERIMQHEAMSCRATSSFNAVRVGGTANKSKLEDGVVAIDCLRDEQSALLLAYTNVYHEISAAIAAVENPRYRELLELRYLNGLTWEQVAERMGLSYVHVVHNLHPAALNMIRVNSI